MIRNSQFYTKQSDICFTTSLSLFPFGVILIKPIYQMPMINNNIRYLLLHKNSNRMKQLIKNLQKININIFNNKVIQFQDANNINQYILNNNINDNVHIYKIIISQPEMLLQCCKIDNFNNLHQIIYANSNQFEKKSNLNYILFPSTNSLKKYELLIDINKVQKCIDFKIKQKSQQQLFLIHMNKIYKIKNSSQIADIVNNQNQNKIKQLQILSKQFYKKNKMLSIHTIQSITQQFQKLAQLSFALPNFINVNYGLFYQNQTKALSEHLTYSDPQNWIHLYRHFIQFAKVNYPQQLYKDILKLQQQIYNKNGMLLQKQLLLQYTKNSFFHKIINNMIRICTNPLQLFCIQPIISQITSEIQNLYLQQIQKNKGIKEFKCFRGGYISEKQIVFFKQNQGKIIQNLGFLSASLSKEVAYSFMTNVIFTIHIKQQKLQQKNLRIICQQKGFIFLQKISQFTNQSQVLFNTLSQFQIKKYEKNIINQQQINCIELEHVNKSSLKQSWYTKDQHLQYQKAQFKNYILNRIIQLKHSQQGDLLLNLQYLTKQSIKYWNLCIQIHESYKFQCFQQYSHARMCLIQSLQYNLNYQQANNIQKLLMDETWQIIQMLYNQQIDFYTIQVSALIMIFTFNVKQTIKYFKEKDLCQCEIQNMKTVFTKIQNIIQNYQNTYVQQYMQKQNNENYQQNSQLQQILQQILFIFFKSIKQCFDYQIQRIIRQQKVIRYHKNKIGKMPNQLMQICIQVKNLLKREKYQQALIACQQSIQLIKKNWKRRKIFYEDQIRLKGKLLYFLKRFSESQKCLIQAYNLLYAQDRKSLLLAKLLIQIGDSQTQQNKEQAQQTYCKAQKLIKKIIGNDRSSQLLYLSKLKLAIFYQCVRKNKVKSLQIIRQCCQTWNIDVNEIFIQAAQYLIKLQQQVQILDQQNNNNNNNNNNSNNNQSNLSKKSLQILNSLQPKQKRQKIIKIALNNRKQIKMEQQLQKQLKK